MGRLPVSERQQCSQGKVATYIRQVFAGLVGYRRRCLPEVGNLPLICHFLSPFFAPLGDLGFDFNMGRRQTETLVGFKLSLQVDELLANFHKRRL